MRRKTNNTDKATNKMSTLTLTSYTVTCICEITGSIVVNDCKTWKKAAKAASPLIQNDVEITHTKPVQDFETDWHKITEADCDDCGEGEWQVSQSAELSMCVEVKAKDWKQAGRIALEIAQDNVEIVSSDDVNVDWQRITEDMVN